MARCLRNRPGAPALDTHKGGPPSFRRLKPPTNRSYIYYKPQVINANHVALNSFFFRGGPPVLSSNALVESNVPLWRFPKQRRRLGTRRADVSFTFSHGDHAFDRSSPFSSRNQMCGSSEQTAAVHILRTLQGRRRSSAVVWPSWVWKCWGRIREDTPQNWISLRLVDLWYNAGNQKNVINGYIQNGVQFPKICREG